MSYNSRSSALAVSAFKDDVRVYIKTSKGDVHEARLDGGNGVPLFDIANEATDDPEQTAGWYPGELDMRAAQDSTLSTVVWGTWDTVVFYQDTGGNIRAMHHWLGGWLNTGVIHADCMQGTSIAEVHSKNSERVMIFYQSRDGYIHAKRSRNYTLVAPWDPPVAIAKACKCTGIAATSWNDGKDLRVYFQDETNVLHEWCAAFETYNSWSVGDFQDTREHGDRTICSMTAIAWGADGPPNIRIYIQEPSNDIIELAYGIHYLEWTPGELRQNAPANSHIGAFCRLLDGTVRIMIFWAGPDEVLHQRFYISSDGWGNPSTITYLQDAEDDASSWDGARFSDNLSGVDGKTISSSTAKPMGGFGHGYTDNTVALRQSGGVNVV